MPWVPAIARVSRSAHSAPSTSALVATRIPGSAAVDELDVVRRDRRRGRDEVGGTDVRRVVADVTAMPSARSDGDRRRVDEVRAASPSWPSPRSRRASPLIPAPPTPTTWTCGARSRSTGSAGMVEHHLGDPASPRRAARGTVRPLTSRASRAPSSSSALSTSSRRSPAERGVVEDDRGTGALEHAGRWRPGGRRARTGAGPAPTGPPWRTARRPSWRPRRQTATSHAGPQVRPWRARSRRRASGRRRCPRRAGDASTLARRAVPSRGTAWSPRASRQRTASSPTARLTDVAPSEPDMTATTVPVAREAEPRRGRSLRASAVRVTARISSRSGAPVTTARSSSAPGNAVVIATAKRRSTRCTRPGVASRSTSTSGRAGERPRRRRRRTRRSPPTETTARGRRRTTSATPRARATTSPATAAALARSARGETSRRSPRPGSSTSSTPRSPSSSPSWPRASRRRRRRSARRPRRAAPRRSHGAGRRGRRCRRR